MQRIEKLFALPNHHVQNPIYATYFVIGWPFMDITLVFFIYGLAFFSMGLALLLESNRSPQLAEAGVLFPLAIFGFVHGAHEWLEMFLDKSDWLAISDPLLVGWLRVIILVLSFSALAIFAVRMWNPQRRYKPHELFAWGAAQGLYTLAVILIGLSFIRIVPNWITYIDASVRYLLAVPFAVLAGLALLRQASREGRQDRPELGGGLRWAGWGFLFYAFTQAVVPPVEMLTGMFLNTETFTELTGFPVQIFRGALAVMITIGLIRAIQAAENERQGQLMFMQQARLDALEQVRKELEKREVLRQELLRRTVIAQEEERTLVARELHDETAQILTAFTLHLATLLEAGAEYPKVVEQVEKLNSLSRQMSQGLYRLVHDLRPAQLDDLGLVAALEFLGDEQRRQLGLEVDLEVSGQPERLDPLIETVLFRVAQEALTNTARHAGVNQASLDLIYQPDVVCQRVSDQGIGFDLQENQLPPRGWGLAGMRERAVSVGGEFRLESQPGAGTVVEVRVPLRINDEIPGAPYGSDNKNLTLSEKDIDKSVALASDAPWLYQDSQATKEKNHGEHPPDAG